MTEEDQKETVCYTWIRSLKGIQVLVPKTFIAASPNSLLYILFVATFWLYLQCNYLYRLCGLQSLDCYFLTTSRKKLPALAMAPTDIKTIIWVYISLLPFLFNIGVLVVESMISQERGNRHKHWKRSKIVIYIWCGCIDMKTCGIYRTTVLQVNLAKSVHRIICVLYTSNEQFENCNKNYHFWVLKNTPSTCE